MDMNQLKRDLSERMCAAAKEDALGEYVAKAVDDYVLGNMTKRSAVMLRQSLPHLSRAVELACPAVMGMSRRGFTSGYGIMSRKGGIGIAVANHKRGYAFTCSPDRDFLPVHTDETPGHFWAAVSDHLEEMGKDPQEEDLKLLTGAILARIGAEEYISLSQTTKRMHDAGMSVIMLISCVCRKTKTQAAGGLIAVPLPAVMESDFDG